MTRWDNGLGGNPLRKLQDASRPLRCVLFGCKPVVGEDVDACRRCGRALLNYDDCAAIVMKPTLRCRLFGCKSGEDDRMAHPETVCYCGRDAYVVGPEGYGIVHEGCCKRCGQPIIPTARIALR